jgi:4-amino-4-deoxy-L-arabinose transferase-like glycosyltransferase
MPKKPTPCAELPIPVGVGDLLALGLIVTCLVAEAAVIRVGIDDLDEGYFVQQAARVLGGQLPYRDFETFYTLGLVYLHAALFGALGGPSLVVTRVVALIARASLALVLYALARPLLRQPLWAALPGVFLLTGLDDSPVRWEPHPGWLSSLFAVLAAWCVTRGTSAGWLVASGAAAGVAYAFKQNTGVFIVAAIVLWTLTVSRAERANRVGIVLLAFAGVTGVWLVPLLIALRGQISTLGGFVGAVNQTGLFSAPEISIVIPLAAVVGGLWLIRRDSEPRLRWLLLAGSALLLTQYPRMDTLHLAWSAPLLLVVGAVALDRARPIVAAAAIVGLIFVAQPTVESRFEYVLVPRATIADVDAPVQTAQALDGVVEEIEQRTRQGEPIFVYPTSPLIYVLSRRPNATRWDHLNPGAADARQIERLQADLESSGVRIIVVDDFWRGVWGDPGVNAPLESWIAQRYEEVARHGSYRVLTARL